MSFEKKAEELGIKIPEPAKPLASYIPAKKVDNYVFTSGQLPFVSGKLLYTGKVGVEVSVEEAQKAAEASIINCLGAVKQLIGSIDSIESIVKLTCFVNCPADFTEQPKVANGASDLLGKIFGESGAHARSAVGVNVLPLNAPVEIEMIVKLK
jgi:enamine deaminase RidA (YjgF/YER057c/UK114 family)